MKQIVVLIISCLFAACASDTDPTAAGYEEPEPRGTDCIFEGTIRDYRVLDDSNLVVSTTRKQKYHMRLSYSAMALSSAWGLGFSTRTGQICPGDEIVLKNGFDVDAIGIYSIRAVNDAEYEHLLVEHGKKVPEQITKPPDQDVAGAEVEELD
jgi:hypothetical protein